MKNELLSFSALEALEFEALTEKEFLIAGGLEKSHYFLFSLLIISALGWNYFFKMGAQGQKKDNGFETLEKESDAYNILCKEIAANSTQSIDMKTLIIQREPLIGFLHRDYAYAAFNQSCRQPYKKGEPVA